MKARFVNEAYNFERGQDPKEAMGIGKWIKGYVVDSIGEDDILERSKFRYIRIDFQGDEWNFSKKAIHGDDIPQTEVLPYMIKKISKLPVLTFKYYNNEGKLPGLFGDWPEDFEFTHLPFIANVLEDEERSFLIDPEGYYYPRYITELV